MIETTSHDEHGNEIRFIRKDTGQDCEVTIIKHDSSGHFISHERCSYSSDKLQEWSCFSESGEVIGRHVMEYGPDVWDAWHKEFDGARQLLKQTFYTWDKEHQAKAELYYDAAGKYLGKKVASLEGGKYRPLHFDNEGNPIAPNGQHNNSFNPTAR